MPDQRLACFDTGHVIVRCAGCGDVVFECACEGVPKSLSEGICRTCVEQHRVIPPLYRTPPAMAAPTKPNRRKRTRRQQQNRRQR